MRKATTRLGRLAAAAGLAVTLGFAPSAFADEIVALKNALYGAGYDITNVSPQMDDSTRAALTKFQKDQGLQATGILDEPTKKALGMIEVQVAAAKPAPAADNAGSQAQASDNATEESAEPTQPEDGAIEEDEDGGWSLW
ncbi:MAG: peptidoglycan-binding domain-containing protein [Pseudomonadota bacterium]|nr:peptidoglycan-binding domain-containing protein [Pseudomonadota bacterium]